MPPTRGFSAMGGQEQNFINDIYFLTCVDRDMLDHDLGWSLLFSLFGPPQSCRSDAQCWESMQKGVGAFACVCACLPFVGYMFLLRFFWLSLEPAALLL